MRKRGATETAIISLETVRFFEGRLASKKPDHVMEAVGISLNTWNKICRGAPIRRSLADRIMHRFDTLQRAAEGGTRPCDQSETWDQSSTNMTTLTIMNRSGEERSVDVEDGVSLMEALRASGFDELQALCGGCCSCATCHVYIETAPDDVIPAMTADESDLLDSSDHRQASSRLSCQVMVLAGLAKAKIAIAPED